MCVSAGEGPGQAGRVSATRGGLLPGPKPPAHRRTEARGVVPGLHEPRSTAPLCAQDAERALDRLRRRAVVLAPSYSIVNRCSPRPSTAGTTTEHTTHEARWTTSLPCAKPTKQQSGRSTTSARPHVLHLHLSTAAFDGPHRLPTATEHVPHEARWTTSPLQRQDTSLRLRCESALTAARWKALRRGGYWESRRKGHLSP